MQKWLGCGIPGAQDHSKWLGLWLGGRGHAPQPPAALLSPISFRRNKSYVPQKEEYMARPTEERKDKTVKLRISEELYREIEERGSNVSETIRNLIRRGLEGNVPQNKSIEKSEKILLKDYVPQKEVEKILREISARCDGEESLREFKAKKFESLVVVREEEWRKKEQEDNAPQNIEEIVQWIMDKAVYKDINEMCRSCQISTHDFYRGVCDLWNSGKLFIEDGKVKSKGEWDLDMFVERCHYINEYPQDVIDKVTKGLR